jgi:hypothetical protein
MIRSAPLSANCWASNDVADALASEVEVIEERGMRTSQPREIDASGGQKPTQNSALS